MPEVTPAQCGTSYGGSWVYELGLEGPGGMATDAQGRITYAVSDDWVTSTDHPATFMAQVVNFTSGGEERWRAAVPVSVRDAAAMPTGEVFVAGV
ncbi:MAG TPA: hypothetical protein VGJ84_16975, partial [Polyangiaceae bacterium]